MTMTIEIIKIFAVFLSLSMMIILWAVGTSALVG